MLMGRAPARAAVDCQITTSGAAPLIVDGFGRVRRSTFTGAAIMGGAEYHRHAGARGRNGKRRVETYWLWNAVQDGIFFELSDPLDLHSASPVNVLCTASRQSSAPRNLRRRFQRKNR